MTSFFDDLSRSAHELSQLHKEDSSFDAALKELEDQAVSVIQPVLAHLDFPEDLRDRVQKLVERHRSEHKRRMAIACRDSLLIQDLHSVFHDLGSRRLATREGIRLTDNPAVFLSVLQRHRDDS